MARKYTIWNNTLLDLEDWKDDLLKEYPDASNDELYNLMIKTNDSYLDDVRTQCNILLPHPILVVADLGLWGERHSDYKVITSGNIRDCFYNDPSEEYMDWYIDSKYDLRCRTVHRKGINNYVYRMYKSTSTEKQRDELRDKLYNGTATRADIVSATRRIGDYVWSLLK